MIGHLVLANRKIGLGEPVFVIAEAGVNHNGRLDMALDLVDAAAESNADAVKFQTFHADALVARDAPKAAYQRQTTLDTESQFDMVQKLQLGRDDFERLHKHATARGLIFFSTPFDVAAVDLLFELGVSLFKVPSGEITNFPLLTRVARTGRPIIASTGMCTLGEVEEAVVHLRAEGAGEIALLHCLSNYPAPWEEVNLRAIVTMAEAFKVPVGFSDHTLGSEAGVAAVALGACIIEKHLTLDRSLPGPDHRSSLDPGSFRAFVETLRRTECMLGDGLKRPQPSEVDVRMVARRSIVAARDLPAGIRLSDRDVTLKRPGTGLPPRQLPAVLGRTTRRALTQDQMLRWADLEPD